MYTPYIYLLNILLLPFYVFGQNSEVCGQKQSKGNTSIVNGTNVGERDFPWHVGVYSSEQNFMCHASLISQKVIMSAAHCFTDFEGNVRESDKYLIAAGKYYYQFDDPRDTEAQYSNVKSIHVPETFQGATTRYQSDISIVILENPFELSANVQPVCVDLNNEFESEQLIPNNYGVFARWDIPRGNEEPSEGLQEIRLPYVPFQQCFEGVPRTFKKYLTNDKICAGFMGNETQCRANSGGALVFLRGNSERYYVRGIASTAPSTDLGECDTNQYQAYTLVSKHLEFIKDLITLNKV